MKLTLIKKSNGNLTKIMKYKDGKVTKDSSQCWLSEGDALTIDLSLEELSQKLRTLQPNEALIHGNFDGEKIKIVSKKNYSGEAGTITRSKDHFQFMEAEGSAVFDHDPEVGQPALTREEFLTTMAEVCPEIKKMGYAWTPSTSSCLYFEGRELLGQKDGMHIYFTVECAGDLPVFAGILFKRLWLAGHGHIFITKDGKQLERTIFDKAVFSPERLDFVAGAICKDGLEQRLPAPVYRPGKVLDTLALAEISEQEEAKYTRLVDEAKRKTEFEATNIRDEYIQIEIKKFITKGMAKDVAEQVVEDRIGGQLSEYDVIYFDKFGPVKVVDVLSDLDKYNKQTCRDPIEYSQGTGKAIFYANFHKKKPIIFSQAHGGRKFFLKFEYNDWLPPIPLTPAVGYKQDQDYPLDLLPEAIKEAAAEVARFCKVPDISPGVVGLSCCATAIGKKAVIVERQGLNHHPAMFYALIAASGERKSPVFKNMNFPLEKYMKSNEEKYKQDMHTYLASEIAIDGAIKNLKATKKKDVDLETITKQIAEFEAKRITPPAHPSLFTTDTTEERLFQKMSDRGGAYAVMSGEGRQVLDALMGKYSGDGKTGDGIYLAGISGDTITRDRIGKENGPEEGLIYNPCLNVCIMVQPDKYLSMAESVALRRSGAIARIWPVWLQSLVGQRFEDKDEPGLNPNRMEKYNNLIDEILYTEQPKYQDSENSCHEAHLSKEACEARRTFHNDIERLMADGEEFEDVRDIASKAVSQTAKLALVLHLAEDPSLLKKRTSVITCETWKRAQSLGEYHLRKAVNVQRIADEDKNFETTRKILKWIKRKQKTEITKTEISQFGPRPRQKVKDLAPIFDLLVGNSYIRKKSNANNLSSVYEVNPVFLNSQLA